MDARLPDLHRSTGGLVEDHADAKPAKEPPAGAAGRVKREAKRLDADSPGRYTPIPQGAQAGRARRKPQRGQTE